MEVYTNRRQRTVAKLSGFMERHPLMLLPCLIAVLFAVMYYGVIGKFKSHNPPSGSYTRCPFRTRVISCLLTVTFLFMVTPVLFTEVFASVVDMGDGTAEKPYRVVDVTTLKAVDDSAYYSLYDDITITPANAWTPITSFSGVFDGQGFTIVGLDDSLFTTNGGTVKDLIIEGANVVDNSPIGIIAGTNVGTIENCRVSGSVTSTGNAGTGGIAGANSGIIKQSSFSGSVNGGFWLGGIAGVNNATIENSYTTANVTGTGNAVGGIAGVNRSRIQNCYTTGQISSSGQNIGGIVGNSDDSSSRVSDCVALNGSVSGSTNVGRIAGTATNTNLIFSLSNNYANMGMNVYGNDTVIDANYLQGSDSTQGISFNSSTTGQAEWESSANFDFSIWSWDSSLNRPVLPMRPTPGEKFTITYYGNGHTSAYNTVPPPEDYIIGKEAKIASPTDLERLDYEFVGWNTEEDGSGFDVGAGAFIRVFENLELYAVWERSAPTFWHTVAVISETTDATGAGAYRGGDIIPIHAGTPLFGRQFVRWETVSAGVLLTDATQPATTFTMPRNAVTVTAVFEDVPTYTVTMEHGTNQSLSSAPFYEGDVISISADNPPQGMLFIEWTANVEGVVFNNKSSADTTFTMPASNVTITANFGQTEPDTFQVTVSGGDGGGYYAGGATVTIEAGEPPTGKQFKEWAVVSGGATLADRNNATTTFIMPSNAVAITAVFDDIPQYNLIITGGTADGGSSFYENTTVTIRSTSSPPTGKQFKEWEVVSGGVTLANSQSETTTFTMPSHDVEIRATFEDIKYTVTVNSIGSTNAIGGGEYAFGETVTINAGTPTFNNTKFVRWDTISAGVTFEDGENSITTFEMPANNVTVTAVWDNLPPEPDLFTVTVESNAPNKSGDGYFKAGTLVEIKAGDDYDGREFSYWTTNNSDVIFADRNARDTHFTMPNGNVIVHAIFSQPTTPTYTVTVYGGTSDGSIFEEGVTVEITASTPEGQLFDKWTADSEDVSFDDEESPTTAFIMPAEDVTVTAHFKSPPPVITDVVIYPTSVNIVRGTEFGFSATVLGENSPSQDVEWSINGNVHPNTTINQEGRLTVHQDQALIPFIVYAVSADNPAKWASAIVTVTEPPPDPPKPPVITVTSVTVNPATVTLNRGGTHTFSAVVAGQNNPSQSVTWTVSGGATGMNTAITSGGVLTVATNETSATLTVTAISEVDNTVSGKATVTVNQPPPPPPNPSPNPPPNPSPNPSPSPNTNNTDSGGSGNNQNDSTGESASGNKSLNSLVTQSLSENNPRVVLDSGTGTIISANTLQAIKANGKTVQIQLENNLVISIDPAKITSNARTIDLNMNVVFVGSYNQLNISGVQIAANSIVIVPAAHGEFGFEAAFSISSSQLKENGINAQNARLFYVSENGNVALDGSLTVNPNGSVTIRITHASMYVLSETAPMRFSNSNSSGNNAANLGGGGSSNLSSPNLSSFVGNARDGNPFTGENASITIIRIALTGAIATCTLIGIYNSRKRENGEFET
ncbi:MAG: InlB B-repeat-containing protein [Oscillospiraceae bacterium]|nr:InlB B-repeat-containing protein [Oscillospiraceae bacterium]